jgi:hypothetical protein
VTDAAFDLDGKRYVWTGERWYSERDFVTPPSPVVHRLNALIPDQITAEDAAAARTARCSASVRETWPEPLASEWLEQYPQLFDAEDLRLALSQPAYHFNEWFAAIHVFERDGALSLVEKYDCKRHRRKVAALANVLSVHERATLADICVRYHVQPPDLFVFIPESDRYWFVEAKGQGGRLSTKQKASHEAISRELGVEVEVVWVAVADD